MRARIGRYRGVVGYLLLTAFILLALDLHHNANIDTLNERDVRSCQQRQILASNQVFVLRFLTSAVQAEIHTERKRIPAPILDRLTDQLAEAERRLAVQNPVQSC